MRFVYFLAYSLYRFNNRSKIKIGHAIKSNILGDKFDWFTQQLETTSERQCLTPDEFKELIELYVNTIVFYSIHSAFC